MLLKIVDVSYGEVLEEISGGEGDLARDMRLALYRVAYDAYWTVQIRCTLCRARGALARTAGPGGAHAQKPPARVGAGSGPVGPGPPPPRGAPPPRGPRAPPRGSGPPVLSTPAASTIPRGRTLSARPRLHRRVRLLPAPLPYTPLTIPIEIPCLPERVLPLIARARGMASGGVHTVRDLARVSVGDGRGGQRW